MSSITKVKFQSICLQIEATKYFKSFVAFWISYLHHDLETALKSGPFNFSTLSYSTINFANCLQHFISSRYALKSLRFAQEQCVSCKPMSIITCITSDATFPKQTLNKVILPPQKVRRGCLWNFSEYTLAFGTSIFLQELCLAEVWSYQQ